VQASCVRKVACSRCSITGVHSTSQIWSRSGCERRENWRKQTCEGISGEIRSAGKKAHIGVPGISQRYCTGQHASRPHANEEQQKTKFTMTERGGRGPSLELRTDRMRMSRTWGKKNLGCYFIPEERYSVPPRRRIAKESLAKEGIRTRTQPSGQTHSCLSHGASTASSTRKGGSKEGINTVFDGLGQRGRRNSK